MKNTKTKPRNLPAWAHELLRFVVPPEEALRQGALAKPKKRWHRVIITGRRG